jgi:hypothetical protein
MTIEESSSERARESFGIFADRVTQHHDDPQCNRRLYRENIASYREHLKNWMTRLIEHKLMDCEDIYQRVVETDALISEMQADPDRFSAPSREPTTPPVAPPDPQ